MKIALIRKEYTLSWGGAESYVVHLSRQLLEMGHEVHVFANTWDLPSDPRITFHKVPVLSFYSPLKNLTFALNTKRLLKEENFDIVSGFSQIYPQDIYRMGDGLHLYFLKTLSTHTALKYLNPRHLSILFIEKQIFKPNNYHHIIANSRMCKRQAIDYYQVPEDKIEVIYNGVDLERFTPRVRETYRLNVRKKLHIGDHETVILFISRNYKRKGLHLLIESLSLLGRKAHNIKILVAGRGNPKPYQRLASKLGFSNNMIFAGEERILEKYYGASDMLVLPTLYDPFSNVCLEALACGLPVITTTSNGAAEIIEEGKNGYIIEDASDTGEIAKHISLLLSKEAREKMVNYAALSVKKYTTAENARKTLALYKKVFTRKNAFSFSHHDGIIVNDEYVSLLSQNKLIDFSKLMYCQDGKIIKQAIKERSTIKLMLKDNHSEIGVYLKRYQHPGCKEWITSLLKFSLPRNAMDEWKNVLAFHTSGIPTMVPISAGSKKHFGLKKESFLLTREIEGVERLDHYLPRHFSPPLNIHHIKEKRTLIKELALLVRRMHLSGLNHRDLYLCHILAKKDVSNSWKIYFADLHRVDQREKVSLRWKVKDLAALNYSADKNIITRADRLRFIKYYQGENRLAAKTRVLIKKIVKKTYKIRSHDLKLKKRVNSSPPRMQRPLSA
jgi:UDP-glucose:(heptosyl)LPS alpha-1,3-glucosyltransferase